MNFALRNGIWHCEISHCEIFALRIWNCEIFTLRNWNWQCKFKIGIAKWHLALRNFALRNFRIAKLKLALRNRFWHCEMAFGIAKFRIAKFSHCEFGLVNFRIAKWVCEIFALRNGSANSLRKSLFADFPCLSSCLQLHLIIFTFPSIFH